MSDWDEEFEGILETSIQTDKEEFNYYFCCRCDGLIRDIEFSANRRSVCSSSQDSSRYQQDGYTALVEYLIESN